MKPAHLLKSFSVVRSDGGVSLLHIITHVRTEQGDFPVIELEADGAVPLATVEAEIAKAFKPDEVARFRAINAEEIPASRNFRDALSDDGTRLVHDMSRARAIHLGRLRAARNEHLDLLDRDWMRATGQGGKEEAQAVEAERQRLRDLPQTMGPQIQAAASVDALPSISAGLLARR